MSGVIDENGVQWQRCNACCAWVDILDLRYEQPSEAHPYGRDLCEQCGPDKPHGLPVRVQVKQ